MKIHEYQAKALFGKYGIPIPKGRAVSSSTEALEAAQDLGSPPYVVKAQIHAGGRGKGGGVVLIGDIGGTAEEEAAAFIKEHFPKPVVTFIAGQTAPPGRRMGHAGAIISGKSGTAQEKMAVLKAAGIRVVVDLTKVGEAVKELMG